MKKLKTTTPAPSGSKGSQVWKRMYRSRYLYLLFALPLLYFIVFKYGAMGWLSIAFFDYNAFLGFAGSKFIGLKYFKQFIMDLLEHPEKYHCAEHLDADSVFPNTHYPGTSHQ